MSVFNTFPNLTQALLDGHGDIQNPGSGGTLNIINKHMGVAVLSAGTYALPTPPRKGYSFYVVATGSVTLTGVTTMVSGDAIQVIADTASTWQLLGGTVLASQVPIADAGTYTDVTTVETALQSVMRDLQVIDIPLTAFAINAVTPLTAWANNAAANPGLALMDSEAMAIRFNNSSTQDQVLKACVRVPTGLRGVPTLNILASKTGATTADATTFTVTAFVAGQGSLHDAGDNLGGTTSAMTGNATAKTVQKVTLAMTTLAEALTGPLPLTTDGTLTIGLAPTANTLNTDDLAIHRVWLTYDSAS